MTLRARLEHCGTSVIFARPAALLLKALGATSFTSFVRPPSRGPAGDHVHASDHHGHRDDHLPPGDGSINWREITGGLEQIGFDGWIMLELSCPNGSSLESHFAHAMGQTARVLA